MQDAQGQYLQLGTSLLQIENEFYSSIRPKRTTQSGETALQALRLQTLTRLQPTRLFGPTVLLRLGLGMCFVRFVKSTR